MFEFVSVFVLFAPLPPPNNAKNGAVIVVDIAVDSATLSQCFLKFVVASVAKFFKNSSELRFLPSKVLLAASSIILCLISCTTSKGTFTNKFLNKRMPYLPSVPQVTAPSIASKNASVGIFVAKL